MQNGIKCKIITYGCNTSTGLYYMKTSKEPLKKKEKFVILIRKAHLSVPLGWAKIF